MRTDSISLLQYRPALQGRREKGRVWKPTRQGALVNASHQTWPRPKSREAQAKAWSVLDISPAGSNADRSMPRKHGRTTNTQQNALETPHNLETTPPTQGTRQPHPQHVSVPLTNSIADGGGGVVILRFGGVPRIARHGGMSAPFGQPVWWHMGHERVCTERVLRPLLAVVGANTAAQHQTGMLCGKL
jgi:hypothetical protein